MRLNSEQKNRSVLLQIQLKEKEICAKNISKYGYATYHWGCINEEELNNALLEVE